MIEKILSNKKYLVVSISSIFIIIIGLIIFFYGEGDKVQIPVVEDIKTINLDCYVYIDKDYNLCKINKDGKNKTILDEDILSFDLSDTEIIYSKKHTDKVMLYSYSMKTLSISKLFILNTDDYIVDDYYIYYMDNKILNRYDIKTTNIENIKELLSNDVVFGYVDKDLILVSYQDADASYTDIINFNDKSKSHMLSNMFNINYCDGYVYGLNSNGYLCRTKDGLDNIEIIDNFSIVKFIIQKNFLFYVNEDGKLNSLDTDGINRQISEYATDFKTIDDNIYFMTSADKNVVYKTQNTGQYKTLILDDINNDFYFDEFNPMKIK